MKELLTEKDIRQIEDHGLTVEKVSVQIENFRKGFGYLRIDRAATVGDGITVLDENIIDRYIKEYSSAASGSRILKFVPASGAATRMFKELFEYAETGEPNSLSEKTVLNIRDFAFYERIEHGILPGDPVSAARAVIDYGAQLPKGLILFHRYRDELRTAVEEHLTEGALYASSCGQVHIHFTVSREHREAFRELVESVSAKYEKRHEVHYTITYSEQSPATDTIAVTPENEPFREADGRLLFRPAGHGALLDNLDRIDADIIFIKNIDNVTTDRLKGDTVIYKQALAGMLATLQKQIFRHLEELDTGRADLAGISDFIERELCYRLPEYFSGLEPAARARSLRRILDRPLRVCAMVRNQGEPGGGPFWVSHEDGSSDLQIGEPTQVAPTQAELLKEGTHFNPVDIVCGVRNYKGGKFNLTEYSDPSAGFISQKSKDGRPLRAQELPGLWNGAMARWNTVFVEVPVSTFTPVKTVTDLLRPEHR